MKKVLVILFVLLLVPMVATQAQNPMYFGARAGLNLGNASVTPDLASKSMRTGLAAGVYGEFGIAQNFAVTLEALYNQGGLKTTVSGVDITWKIDEILIPISAKYFFPMENSAMKPFVFGGVDLGFVAKAEAEAGGVAVDIKDQLESMDFGVHFGAGVGYEISPGTTLFLDGRYQLGLKDVAKDATMEVKPNNIGIMAGVSFKIN
jgi:opacity protein-like surface antigen